MPHSTDLNNYPDSCWTILNTAYVRGALTIPCTSQSPEALRLYLYSFKKALRLAAEAADARKAEGRATIEASRRFSQLAVVVDREAEPPTITLAARDRVGMGGFLRQVQEDLEAERTSPGQSFSAALQERLQDRREGRPEDPESVAEELADMDSVINDLFNKVPFSPPKRSSN
jgi:hypothetical protein